MCRAGVTLAVKGGSNGESHNHNDVGSFILFRDGKPLIVDAGNMTYTAKTFSGERYTLWNVRSLYHNVPVICGREQLPGAEYRAERVQELPGGLSLGLEKAYGSEANLCTYDRCCELGDDGHLSVRDRIVLRKPGQVQWVFMLREKPVIRKGRIETESMVLRFPEKLAAAAEEIPGTDARMASSFPGSLYRVLLSAEGTELDVTFTVGRNGTDE